MQPQCPGTNQDAVIARAVRGLGELSSLPVAFGGPVAKDGRSFVITELSGTRTQSLRRLRVGTGLGLGGKALALSRPVTVQDYANAQGITHKYDQAVAPELLHAVMAMPVQVNDTVRAVLYLASRERISLGDRLVEEVAPVLRRIERDLMVEEEVTRRVAAITNPLTERDSPALRLPRQDARELYAELAEITESISDLEVRGRLRKLCDRVISMSAQAGVTDEDGSATVRLAPRERDVLSYVAIGCTNDEIADRLGLLPNTVKSYVKTAMRKLEAGNRIQAAHRARNAGLIELPEDA
jgi:DNA-binding CsgD family transcriptional regulator